MKTMLALSRQRRLWVCGWIAACGMVASHSNAQSMTPRITSEISNFERAPLKGSLHPMAQAQFDAGRMPAATKLNSVSIVFSRSAEQQAELDVLIAAQQDPSSPLYHQWLTPDQFAARFGVADADLNKVKSWLAQQGFSVDSVARSRNMIRFSGAASQVEQAFFTQMHYYNVQGVRHFAPSSELSVPSALAPIVLGVRNLHDFRPKPMHVSSTRPDFTSNQSGYTHFAPGDIAIAYNINPLYQSGIKGVGQSIAIIGQSAIVTSDIEAFQSAASLSIKDPTLVLVPGTGSSQIFSGDESESDIDLEWSGAIAPGANILFVYVGSNLNTDIFDSIQYAVDQNIAPIISVSYGACETQYTASTLQPFETTGQQAIAQGQTIVVSSGDSGSTGCSGFTNLTTAQQQALAVSYPASSAYVTAIGGTEITAADAVTGTPPGYWAAAPTADVLTSALQYIPEVAWNDDTTSGLSSSGGGASVLVPRPAWQTGVTGISAGSERLVPDISFYSSPDNPGYLFCSSDTSAGITGSCSNGFRDANKQYLTVAGGTSFAAPIFAGMVAIINQAKGYTGGQGLINPTLYTLAADGAKYASAFHDVTAGNNDCLGGSAYCNGTIGFNAGTGYDEVTGLGSVNLANLVAVWPASSVLPALVSTSTSITASNYAPAVGASDTFTITVVASSGTVTPSGNVNLSIDGGGTAYSNGGTTATVTLIASGTAGTATATYQTSFATAGTHQIVAKYAGDAAFAASNGVVQVSLAGVSSGKGTFTITPSPATLTVKQGSAGTEFLTVTPTPAGGYTGTVLLTFATSNDFALSNLCYGFSTMTSTGGGSVAVVAASAVTTQLVFSTNPADCGAAAQPGGGIPLHRMAGVKMAKNNAPNPAPLGLAFAGLLLAGFLGRYSRKFYTMAGLIALLAVALAVAACGGGNATSSNSSTPPNIPPTGTYTITVTGQDSATSTITGTTTFNFTIQ